MRKKEIVVTKRLLEANDLIAERMRKKLKGRCFIVNMISSPGSGKTTLLERTAELLKDRMRMAIITADIDTDRDKKRLARKGVRVVQLKTMGECHLEASTIEQVVEELLAEEPFEAIFVENIGNLICPTEFDLGENLRVLLLSTAEGDDKPRKYPVGFRTCNLLVITKKDLLPYVSFDAKKVAAEARQLNSKVKVISLSAVTGEGLGEWTEHVLKAVKKCTSSA